MHLNPADSLGARILWQMAVRIALVIALVTLASYWHVYRSATATGIGTLTEYVRERGERESWLFLLDLVFASNASCILPADVNRQFRYDAGLSVGLDDIIQRTREAGLAGTHNVIFRADGKLVSHPDVRVMAVLRENKGEYAIPASGDAHLKAIYQAVVQAPGVNVLTLDAYDEYLGVARIKGPDWYFVSVLPKKVLSRPAEATAQMILWLGLTALLLELAIVGWIIRRQVSRPLALVMQRLVAFGKGHSGTRMPSDGSDELAQLGRTFNQMAQTLEERQQQLRDHAASLESKVSERTQQLQEKDRAKTRFLTAASHDLRQPLQAAALFVDHLKHSPLDQAQRQTVAYLDLSMTSLRELIDGLLDISRLEANAVTPEISAIRVQQVFSTLDAEFASQAHAKGLRLKIHDLQPGILVQSDPQLLMTILRNLVSNAVKYTEHGGILIGARRRGDAVVLQVWDTGIGIHQDQLARIYEEFYQINNPQRDRSKGFGMGLAIASRAAKLLDYPLHCVSRPGRGTRFELLLPCQRERPVESGLVSDAPKA